MNDSSYNIINKMQINPNINVWITALTGDKVKKIIDTYFIKNIFKKKLLISVCDELEETLNYTNVWHINSTKKSIIGAIINIFRFKVINNYKSLYVFYDNDHKSHADLFKKYWNSLLTNITTIYVNIDKSVEKLFTLSDLKNQKNNNIINTNNTAFLYFSNTMEIFFEIFSIVENPSLIYTPDYIDDKRHYNYYTSYINTDYITIIEYMKKYISSFIIDNNYDDFFYNYLRCYIITQSLTPSQNEKLNYIKYIYYRKNTPISTNFLKDNRITIYTILIEKALLLAKDMLYRNISSNQLYQNTLLIEERLYGHLLSELMNNNDDKNYFMRNLFITTPIEHLYDVLKPINKLYKLKNIISTVSININ